MGLQRNYRRLVIVVMYFKHTYGANLCNFVYKNFKEFQQLVPQAGLRLKLKNLVESVSACKLKSEFVKYLSTSTSDIVGQCLSILYSADNYIHNL